MVAPVRPRTVSTGEEEEKSAKVFSRSARAAARDGCQSPRAGWGVSLATPARKTNNRDQSKQPALVPSSSLTIWDHDASDHGSKHNSQRQGFEPERGHVAPGSEGAVLLLGGQGWRGEFSSAIPVPRASAIPSAPQQFPQQCSLQLQPIPAVIPTAVPQSPCRDSESSTRPRAGGRSSGVQQEGEVPGEELCSARERCSPTALGAGPFLLCYATGAAPPAGRDSKGRMGAAGQLWRNSRGPLLPIPSHPTSQVGGVDGRVPSVPCRPSRSLLCCCTDGRGRQSNPFRAQPGTG